MAKLTRHSVDLSAIDRPGLHLAAAPNMSLVRAQIRDQSALKSLENRLNIDLPVLGGVVTSGDIAAFCVSPEEWVFIAPDDGSDALSNIISSTLSGTFSLVVDISHAATILIIAGEQALDMLNAHCPLDLRGGHFSAGCCARSSFGATDIMVARIGPSERYLLVIDQTMASYIFRLMTGG